jgi:hypothetical protein
LPKELTCSAYFQCSPGALTRLEGGVVSPTTVLFSFLSIRNTWLYDGSLTTEGFLLIYLLESVAFPEVDFMTNSFSGSGSKSKNEHGKGVFATLAAVARVAFSAAPFPLLHHPHMRLLFLSCPRASSQPSCLLPPKRFSGIFGTRQIGIGVYIHYKNYKKERDYMM